MANNSKFITLKAAVVLAPLNPLLPPGSSMLSEFPFTFGDAPVASVKLMATAQKKRGREEDDINEQNEDIILSKKSREGHKYKATIYILKNKLTSKRVDHLKSLAIKNGFGVAESYK